MQIETAIQQHLIARKETASRAELKFELTVLGRLQEYLEGDSALDGAEAIRPADLLGFIREWYRDGEDVNASVAERLVRAVSGWAHWLEAHLSRPAEPAAHSLSSALSPFQESLPRAARATEALRRHVRREDLGSAIPVADVPGGSPLGTISAGLTRVLRPTVIDYERAEEDRFEVVEVGDRHVNLRSPVRDHLGEGLAAPVAVPTRVARLLRPGDILHGEIAPDRTGWEIVNVETVSPGGLDDRA